MDWKKLIRTEKLDVLLANYLVQEPRKGTGKEIDFEPVVRMWIPGTDMMWLLTEIDEDGMAFGFCQIQCGELGYVSMEEMADMDIVVEDVFFKPKTTLAGYAALARRNGGYLIL